MCKNGVVYRKTWGKPTILEDTRSGIGDPHRGAKMVFFTEKTWGKPKILEDIRYGIGTPHTGAKMVFFAEKHGETQQFGRI